MVSEIKSAYKRRVEKTARISSGAFIRKTKGGLSGMRTLKNPDLQYARLDPRSGAHQG
ncbi:protein of unassigned function [Methylobacterium oryzae CBMB20]|uniref:Protein of unassigned function n=1 Tax=Methylobacterium oryzae CBMB20 TaxID=693986 RepID=A0A089Q0Y3_9HYPH|nr:protein of unassigned function [Methylobacterium oryzae CBMB20]